MQGTLLQGNRDKNFDLAIGRSCERYKECGRATHAGSQ